MAFSRTKDMLSHSIKIQELLWKAILSAHKYGVINDEFPSKKAKDSPKSSKVVSPKQMQGWTPMKPLAFERMVAEIEKPSDPSSETATGNKGDSEASNQESLLSPKQRHSTTYPVLQTSTCTGAASNVIRFLGNLTDSRQALLVTIRQPSAVLFKFSDELILLNAVRWSVLDPIRLGALATGRANLFASSSRRTNLPSKVSSISILPLKKGRLEA